MSSDKVPSNSKCSAISNLVLNTQIKMIWNIFIYFVLLPVLLYGFCLLSIHFHRDYINTELSLLLNESKPVYWIYNKGRDEHHLKHVSSVLTRLGYRRGSNESDWDLLWAHDYPFRILANNLKNLKHYQKINHIPGCGFITNKVDLSTTDAPYIPASFKIPEDKENLLDYIMANPQKKFVQKSNSHRGITIKNPQNINFNERETFVQEYIEKPYLVDGYKFDIGVYTVITSIDPLRIYVYKGDVLFRFCPHKYYPFDPEDLDKYVVGDDYLPIWNVPSLQKYYTTMGFSMKDTFDAYVTSKGEDSNKVWDNIYEAITLIVLKKEKLIADILKQYSQKRNFFELVRFDFVLDEDLNVFVMEANMSPNLSSAHYPPNRLLYEQVIFNLFALIGMSQRVDPQFRRETYWNNREVEVADKNLVVLPSMCSMCTDCFRVECLLCKTCFTDEMRLILTQSYIEHQNKMDYKRIFPPAITKNMTLKDYSLKNQLLVRWYQGKCEIDSSWCN
ncbi:hypothetical protein PV328_003024 [Microctonus aethiopoides]|uniref:Tubulin polyglutamylase TTLL6 n=1 Tax=Microctonus aethiopoides TaxID=144406 RepID=A0AA39F7H9_9HYME|nr:hypothetical protein PV328_003024 [Microctonus aethiopoides]